MRKLIILVTQEHELDTRGHWVLLEHSFAPLFVCHRLWDCVWAALGCMGPGLEITASQWPMSGLIGELTGRPFVLPVMLTSHI